VRAERGCGHEERTERFTELTDDPSAEPHTDVQYEDFHTHISRDISQPLRARYLMMWCIKRAMAKEKKPSKESEKTGKSSTVEHTAEGDEMVASIMQELLRVQAAGDIEDSIFSGKVWMIGSHGIR
jgi:hypothetical protein